MKKKSSFEEHYQYATKNNKCDRSPWRGNVFRGDISWLGILSEMAQFHTCAVIGYHKVPQGGHHKKNGEFLFFFPKPYFDCSAQLRVGLTIRGKFPKNTAFVVAFLVLCIYMFISTEGALLRAEPRPVISM